MLTALLVRKLQLLPQVLPTGILWRHSPSSGGDLPRLFETAERLDLGFAPEELVETLSLDPAEAHEQLLALQTALGVPWESLQLLAQAEWSAGRLWTLLPASLGQLDINQRKVCVLYAIGYSIPQIVGIALLPPRQVREAICDVFDKMGTTSRQSLARLLLDASETEKSRGAAVEPAPPTQRSATPLYSTVPQRAVSKGDASAVMA